MRILFGLLALALMGADRPAQPRPNQISYDLRVVELDGVDWRADVYPKLQVAAHQGPATVWTAPREVAALIVKAAQSRPRASIITSPKIIAQSEAPAHVSAGGWRHVITDMKRVADGPVNHASTVAWVPTVERNREGVSASMAGRKLDQGVLTRFTIDDTRVVSVHEVKLTEVQEPAQGKPGEKRWDKVAVKFQVPEVASSEVTGEWLIPNDGALVVSLGVRTVAEKDGKAGVRERIVLLEANPIEGPQAVPQTQAARGFPGVSADALDQVGFTTVSPPVIGVSTTAVPIPWPMSMPMPAPTVPSRSLPQPVNAHGNPVALPPLPSDRHTPPTTMPDSSEPCATPQNHTPRSIVEPVPEARSTRPPADSPPDVRSEVDPESTRAGFVTGAVTTKAAGPTACPDLVGPPCCAGGIAGAVSQVKTNPPADKAPCAQSCPFTVELRGVIRSETRALPSPSSPAPK